MMRASRGGGASLKDMAKGTSVNKKASEHIITEDDAKLTTVYMDSDTQNYVTIPKDIDIPIGTKIYVVQEGIGNTIIRAVDGVSINDVANGEVAIQDRYKEVVIAKRGENRWIAMGAHVKTIFDPTRIRVLVWLDAADVSTIAASGNNVTQWKDKSGNDLHAAIEADSPVSGAVLQNNHNTITFGANQSMLLDLGGRVDSPISVFMVARSSATGPNVQQFYRGDAPYQNRLSIYDKAHLAMEAGEGANKQHFADHQFHCYSTVWKPDPQISYTRVDGAAVVSRNVRAGYTRKYRIGVNMTSEICEMIFINGAATEYDTQRIEGYLAHKWGLESSLATGHQFKAVKP